MKASNARWRHASRAMWQWSDQSSWWGAEGSWWTKGLGGQAKQRWSAVEPNAAAEYDKKYKSTAGLKPRGHKPETPEQELADQRVEQSIGAAFVPERFVHMCMGRPIVVSQTISFLPQYLSR